MSVIEDLQTSKDVMNTSSDTDLVTRYKLNHAGVLYVIDLMKGVLQRATLRSHALTPHIKVLITLRYLTTEKIQLCNTCY